MSPIEIIRMCHDAQVFHMGSRELNTVLDPSAYFYVPVNGVPSDRKCTENLSEKQVSSLK